MKGSEAGGFLDALGAFVFFLVTNGDKTPRGRQEVTGSDIDQLLLT